MVSIDTVYQRVLVLANKEQRGYITPQEFNLLANHAQMEIFEQYFYDINQYNRTPGNTQEYSDPLSVLYEKIGIFEQVAPSTFVQGSMPVDGDGFRAIPQNIYKIGTVFASGRPVELLNSKDFDLAALSPLTMPTRERPIGCITTRGLRISPSTIDGDVNLSFIFRPSKVEWAYVIVNDKALYNDNIAIDFELHQSEETELVYKILKLAGINLKAQEIVQVGQALEQTQVQQEKQ